MERAVNIRTGPSTTATIITQARPGDVFELKGTRGGWYEIAMFSGEYRYLHSDFASRTSSVPSLPTAVSTRRQAFVEIVKAQDRAVQEAERRFPRDYTAAIDLERLLCDRYELPIFRRYGIAPPHNGKLVSEGIRKNRLLLIDTPEMEQEPFGALAKTFLEALAPPGTELELRLDVQECDRYGRLLAYAYLTDGRMINRELVRRGFAQTMTIPPNVRHVELIRAAADSARNGNAGLWAFGGVLAGEEGQRGPVVEEPKRADRGKCHSSYPDVCIPPPPPDLDCGEISHRRFRVVGSDPHRFDGTGTGWGVRVGSDTYRAAGKGASPIAAHAD